MNAIKNPIRLLRRARDDSRPIHELGYRQRLLLARLEGGRIASLADAHAARDAARACGRRDLQRKAERVRQALAAPKA